MLAFGIVFTLCLACQIEAAFPPQGTNAHPIRFEEQTQGAKLVSGDRPKYPPLALAAKIEGTVRLDLLIGADGAVTEVNVLLGHPLLVQSALNAARTWRYTPTLVNGAPVEVIAYASVDFYLPGHSRDTFLAPYREAVRKHPNDAEAHITLAYFLREVGRLDEAFEELQRALAVRPNLPRAHFAIAKVLAEKNDDTGAVAEYREGLRLDPKNAEMHRELALLFEKAGETESALAEYKAALQLKPKEGMYHYNLAQFLVKRGDVEGAITEFCQAIRLDRGFPFANFELGKALEQKGDLHAALEQYHIALKALPGNRKIREATERLENQLAK